MRVLEQHRYRNPLDILIDEENRTCKGCQYEDKAVAFGQTVWICLTKDQSGKRRNHGKRCKSYKEREAK